MTAVSSWFEVGVGMNPVVLEEISAGLFALGCEGIAETEDGFRLYFAAGEWNTATENRVLRILRKADPEFSRDRMHTVQIPARNWNEEWKKSFKPFRAAPGVIIQPDWESVEPAAGEQVITITPKMAFGTGHHETTRLMLRLIPEYIATHDAVLDLGTGSGILAIYALRCGAGKVTGLDTDPEAIRNFQENCQLNGLADSADAIPGSLSDLPEGRQYDLILANIDKKTLLELAGQLAGYTHGQGFLLLSGILENDVREIRNAYEEAGWRFVKRVQEGEWAGVVLELRIRN
jgi:ribosomal protein L11 methyltransferase